MSASAIRIASSIRTSVSAFSTRARAGAPVSVTLRWEELTTAVNPQAWTVLTVEKRLARLRQDPWNDYWRSKQRLAAKATAALRAL